MRKQILILSWSSPVLLRFKHFPSQVSTRPDLLDPVYLLNDTIHFYCQMLHSLKLLLLLRVPWTVKRSNQSILKEISPGCLLEGLILKLKLQYFGLLMWRADSFEKILMLVKIEGRRRRGWRGWDGWMVSPTQWTWVWVNSGSWWWTWRSGVLWFMGLQRVRHDYATELNWTDCILH